VWLEQSGCQSEWKISVDHTAESGENWTGPFICETARMLVQDWPPNFEMDSLSVSNIIYGIFYDLLKWKICSDYDDESTSEVLSSPEPVRTS